MTDLSRSLRFVKAARSHGNSHLRSAFPGLRKAELLGYSVSVSKTAVGERAARKFTGQRECLHSQSQPLSMHVLEDVFCFCTDL